MASRFVEGEGRPILYRYDASDSLQGIINLHHVSDTQSSYVRISFIPYPSDEDRFHDLLSGDVSEDPPIGYKAQFEIHYDSLLASTLQGIYNKIIEAKDGGYLKLQPRDDNTATYKVVYKGDLKLQSKNRWRHNVTLTFETRELVSSLSLTVPS